MFIVIVKRFEPPYTHTKKNNKKKQGGERWRTGESLTTSVYYHSKLLSVSTTVPQNRITGSGIDTVRIDLCPPSLMISGGNHVYRMTALHTAGGIKSIHIHFTGPHFTTSPDCMW